MGDVASHSASHARSARTTSTGTHLHARTHVRAALQSVHACTCARAGKLLVLGCVFGVVEPLLRIAALLSVQSPFMRLDSASGGRAADDQADARCAAAATKLEKPGQA